MGELNAEAIFVGKGVDRVLDVGGCLRRGDVGLRFEETRRRGLDRYWRFRCLVIERGGSPLNAGAALSTLPRKCEVDSFGKKSGIGEVSRSSRRRGTDTNREQIKTVILEMSWVVNSRIKRLKL